MEVLTTWPWGTIWQAIAALASVLVLIYAPYALLWHSLRGDIQETRNELRADIQETRNEMRSGFDKIDRTFSEMRAEFKSEFRTVHAEFKTVHEIDKRVTVLEHVRQAEKKPADM